MTRQERARRILSRLIREYPDPRCALEHENAFQLLVATILSAQCTDERVNRVTPELFSRYPTPQALAVADSNEVMELIRSTGFFRNKTRSLLGSAVAISREHGGRVPDTMEELLALPGVARKTANVVLGTWFGKNVGVVVDTHVHRLSRRMGLCRLADPKKIEPELMKLFPQTEWTNLSHRLIAHGRRVCLARLPRCEACVLGPDVCPSYDLNPDRWRGENARASREGKTGGARKAAGKRTARTKKKPGGKKRAGKEVGARKKASGR